MSILSWFKSPTPHDSEVPPGATGPPASQGSVEGLVLYQYSTCPFCVRVRHAVRKLNLDIEVRDVRKDRDFHQELVEQGGKGQVPCLRIENEQGDVDWLYESGEIVRYLSRRFTPA